MMGTLNVISGLNAYNLVFDIRAVDVYLIITGSMPVISLLIESYSQTLRYVKRINRFNVVKFCYYSIIFSYVNKAIASKSGRLSSTLDKNRYI